MQTSYCIFTLVLCFMNSLSFAVTKPPAIAMPALPLLPEALENIHARFDVRWQGFLKWAEAKRDPATLEALATRHGDWLIRNAALVVTQSRSFEKGRALATRMLDDKALIVRMAAVEVLKESLNDQSVRDTLWDALYAKVNYHKGQSLPIRPMILEMLGQTANSKERERFKILAEESDKNIKILASSAMQKIGTIE